MVATCLCNAGCSVVVHDYSCEYFSKKVLVYGAHCSTTGTAVPAADANTRVMSFGIESGNQEILDFYHKNINLADVYKRIKYAASLGIYTVSNFIFSSSDNGLTQFSIKEMQEIRKAFLAEYYAV